MYIRCSSLLVTMLTCYVRQPAFCELKNIRQYVLFAAFSLFCCMHCEITFEMLCTSFQSPSQGLVNPLSIFGMSRYHCLEDINRMMLLWRCFMFSPLDDDISKNAYHPFQFLGKSDTIGEDNSFVIYFSHWPVAKTPTQSLIKQSADWAFISFWIVSG